VWASQLEVAISTRIFLNYFSFLFPLLDAFSPTDDRKLIVLRTLEARRGSRREITLVCHSHRKARGKRARGPFPDRVIRFGSLLATSLVHLAILCVIATRVGRALDGEIDATIFLFSLRRDVAEYGCPEANELCGPFWPLPWSRTAFEKALFDR